MDPHKYVDILSPSIPLRTRQNISSAMVSQDVQFDQIITDLLAERAGTTISGHPLGSDADNEHHRATGEQVPKLRPFITSHSGGAEGELYVKVKVRTMEELHQAHDIVMDAFDPDLMRRVAAKAGVDLGGNPLPEPLTDARIAQLRELQGLGKLSTSRLVLDIDKALAELQQRRAEPISFVWIPEMYEAFTVIRPKGWPGIQELLNLWRALHKAAGYK